MNLDISPLKVGDYNRKLISTFNMQPFGLLKRKTDDKISHCLVESNKISIYIRNFMSHANNDVSYETTPLLCT